jgi:KDO2-lipid IV(A) lauroyltransferase
MLNHHIREAVLDNLSHVLPNAPRRVRRVLARKIVRNVVKNYYDVIRIPKMSPADLERTITVHGIEHLDNALKLGKGVIMISAHMGNFSIVAQLGAARNYDTSVVAEDIEPPLLYDYVNNLRGHFGLKMLMLGGWDLLTFYLMIRNFEVMLLAVDRDVNDEGMPVPFFGALADMPHGAVALALRTGAALLPGYTLRLPNNSSVVIIEEPLQLERTGDRDEDVRINMLKVAQTLEKYILKAPDQWVVLQRIWDKDYTKDQGPAPPEQNGHSNEQVPPSHKELATTSG